MVGVYKVDENSTWEELMFYYLSGIISVKKFSCVSTCKNNDISKLECSRIHHLLFNVCSFTPKHNSTSSMCKN